VTGNSHHHERYADGPTEKRQTRGKADKAITKGPPGAASSKKKPEAIKKGMDSGISRWGGRRRKDEEGGDESRPDQSLKEGQDTGGTLKLLLPAGSQWGAWAFKGGNREKWGSRNVPTHTPGKEYGTNLRQRTKETTPGSNSV